MVTQMFWWILLIATKKMNLDYFTDLLAWHLKMDMWQACMHVYQMICNVSKFLCYVYLLGIQRWTCGRHACILYQMRSNVSKFFYYVAHLV